MKYPCIVFDHDDTVVNSSATMHYPCFVQYMAEYHPEVHYTLEEFFEANFDPGVVEMYRSIGMSDEEMLFEQEYWKKYVENHVPQVFDGVRELMWEYKNAGGILCVVSHSYSENILRDYKAHGLPEPDEVYGWECPKELRKPNPYPLLKIMEKYKLRPDELLVLDDLKPGYDMAKACGASFAAAGWAYDIQKIEDFMRRNSKLYFKTVAELREFLNT